jgi:K+-transporting ATPase ATPase B chain
VNGVLQLVVPPNLTDITDRIARAAGTPLVVADGGRVLGVIHLEDVVKGGMRERFAQLRAMGIHTVMITGDNPLAAAAIAVKAGVDDFLAQATPKGKVDLIRQEQAKGRLVAMAGDGIDDAPALAQSDVGMAMNTGTMAAKEAGNMVDLDSNPTKLIEVVAIGKQMLMTRGALMTFSIASNVAKYLAILPAMFMATYPELAQLNIMSLHSPESAVLATVIFNALIIIGCDRSWALGSCGRQAELDITPPYQKLTHPSKPKLGHKNCSSFFLCIIIVANTLRLSRH